MKKAVKIVLGVLGALGIGLVGLILACHFNPGLSDSIAGKLYNNKIMSGKLSSEKDSKSEGDAESDDGSEQAILSGDGVISSGETGSEADNSQGEGDVQAVSMDLKTLADYGLTEANVINTLPEYFEDCFKQLSAGKGEDISFYNVVRDKGLAESVLHSYDDDSYRRGFMDQFMDDYHIATCGWNVDTEDLLEGYVLVTHSYTKGPDVEE